MLYARDGDTLLLHGSIASRLIRKLGDGIEACLSVTIVDGLVLARSHFHHSANYRSVVAFGACGVLDRCRGRRSARCTILSMRCCLAGLPSRVHRIATNLRRLLCCILTLWIFPQNCAAAIPRMIPPTPRCRSGPAWCRSSRLERAITESDCAIGTPPCRCRCRRGWRQPRHDRLSRQRASAARAGA